MTADTLITVPDDLDAAQVAKAAEEALTQPSHSAWYDDRYFETHGCVWAWADKSDDILAESNYHAALDALNGAVAHDESGASEERGDDVLDVTASHWLVNTMRHLFVRVYTDDSQTAYTPAFLEAVRLRDRYRDYPVLDESDYSERESKAFDESVCDAIDAAARDYPDDTPAEQEAFAFLLSWDEGHRDAIYQAGYPDADYDEVARVYALARSEHFEWLAQRCLPFAVSGVLPGQEPLPGL